MAKLPFIKPKADKIISFYYSDCRYRQIDIVNGLGCATNTAKKIFDIVKAAQAERNVKSYNPREIDRDVMFDVFGWDIQKLEKNMKARQRLGI